VDSEENIAGYEIERSTDGWNFEVIGEAAAVKTGQTSAKTIPRQFRDGDKDIVYGKKPIYYRVKVLDNNGEFVYTATQLVDPAKGLTLNR
jgi:hypothetical protein